MLPAETLLSRLKAMGIDQIATLHECAVLPALACLPLPARHTCQVTSHSHLAFISRAAKLLAFLLRALALVSD